MGTVFANERIAVRIATKLLGFQHHQLYRPRHRKIHCPHQRFLFHITIGVLHALPLWPILFSINSNSSTSTSLSKSKERNSSTSISLNSSSFSSAHLVVLALQKQCRLLRHFTISFLRIPQRTAYPRYGLEFDSSNTRCCLRAIGLVLTPGAQHARCR